MERSGSTCATPDLEDELIRALGADAVQRVVEAQGDLGPFRTLQKQPQWQGRPVEEQLRRFMGSGGRRKIRYARFLVEALDLGRRATAARPGARSRRSVTGVEPRACDRIYAAKVENASVD